MLLAGHADAPETGSMTNWYQMSTLEHNMYSASGGAEQCGEHVHSSAQCSRLCRRAGREGQPSSPAGQSRPLMTQTSRHWRPFHALQVAT